MCIKAITSVCECVCEVMCSINMETYYKSSLSCQLDLLLLLYLINVFCFLFSVSVAVTFVIIFFLFSAVAFAFYQTRFCFCKLWLLTLVDRMNESEVDQTNRRNRGTSKERHTLVDFLYNCAFYFVVLFVLVCVCVFFLF